MGAGVSYAPTLLFKFLSSIVICLNPQGWYTLVVCSVDPQWYYILATLTTSNDCDVLYSFSKVVVIAQYFLMFVVLWSSRAQLTPNWTIGHPPITTMTDVLIPLVEV